MLVVWISLTLTCHSSLANGPGDLGSIPGRVIPKTQKMVLDAILLNTQHYKVLSRVKWSNPGKGVTPSPTPWCSSYRKGILRVTLNYGRQLYLQQIYDLKVLYLEHLFVGFYPMAWDIAGAFKALPKKVTRSFTLRPQFITLAIMPQGFTLKGGKVVFNLAIEEHGKTTEKFKHTINFRIKVACSGKTNFLLSKQNSLQRVKC